MKKLKAFTLIELTISMLISSIVIGITYSAFLFFTRRYEAYRQSSGVLTEYRLFKEAFQNDLENAEEVKDSMPGLILVKGGNNDIVYAWSTRGVERRLPEATDSFRLVNSDMTIRYVNDTLLLAREIEFRFTYNKTILSTTFTKQYSANQLMKAEKNGNE